MDSRNCFIMKWRGVKVFKSDRHCTTAIGGHVENYKIFVRKCLVSLKLLHISFFQAQILVQRQKLHKIGLVLEIINEI